ncbi:MAG: DUF4876 domain-containing protein [Rikenellaceae bacterium]
MKKIVYLFILIALVGCNDHSSKAPYEEDELSNLNITVSYPDEYSDYDLKGYLVSITDIDRGNNYSATVDSEGYSTIQLTNGRYIVQYSGKHNFEIFNATADQVLIANRDLDLQLNPQCSVSGSLLIKEIYCGGCMKTPEEGTYQFDKYIIVHNNSSETTYLDGLCYGILDPYNSQGTNIWLSNDPLTGETIYPDELYLVQAIWQISGNGTDFPLAPGEDAVICNLGAIDHTAQYPLSVNLNKEDYFVLYDNVLFPNTLYHPAPGDKISPDRYLDVAIKLGVANAWTLSVYSPAPVIFRPIGTTLQEYLLEDDVVFWKPASAYDQIARIPFDWVIDGVEVFYGGSSDNKKRFNPIIDAGYVVHSELYDGKTLHRYVDEEASAEAGYEVLVDTNNSSSDFYERSEASLRNE